MKVVAVDLDGTILEYDGWKGEEHFGRPIEGVREALQKLKDMGFRIVVWTCRGDAEKVARKLRELGIPFDYVNANPGQPENTSCKIFADYYVDDRAIEFRGDWREVLEKIAEREDVEILDWSVTEHWEKIDYVRNESEGRKKIEGLFRFAGKTYEFVYDEYWEPGNGGGSVEVRGLEEVGEIVAKKLKEKLKELI